MHMSMRMYMHTCVYVYMHTCAVYLCMFICVWMYTCMHLGVVPFVLIEVLLWFRVAGVVFVCGGVTVMGKHWHVASNNGFGGVALADKVGASCHIPSAYETASCHFSSAYETAFCYFSQCSWDCLFLYSVPRYSFEFWDWHWFIYFYLISSLMYILQYM